MTTGSGRVTTGPLQDGLRTGQVLGSSQSKPNMIPEFKEDVGIQSTPLYSTDPVSTGFSVTGAETPVRTPTPSV